MVLAEQFRTVVATDFAELVVGIGNIALDIRDADDGMLVQSSLEAPQLHLMQARFGLAFIQLIANLGLYPRMPDCPLQGSRAQHILVNNFMETELPVGFLVLLVLVSKEQKEWNQAVFLPSRFKKPPATFLLEIAVQETDIIKMGPQRLKRPLKHINDVNLTVDSSLGEYVTDADTLFYLVGNEQQFQR